MTEAVYTATAEYIVEMEQRPVKHRVSVSGVLKRLGVSRSGYIIIRYGSLYISTH